MRRMGSKFGQNFRSVRWCFDLRIEGRCSRFNRSIQFFLDNSTGFRTNTNNESSSELYKQELCKGTERELH